MTILLQSAKEAIGVADPPHATWPAGATAHRAGV